MTEQKRLAQLHALLVALNYDGTAARRRHLQSVVYLLETLGHWRGYRFHWYSRGPYSPDLTADALTVSEGRIELPPSTDPSYGAPEAPALFAALRHHPEAPIAWAHALAAVHYLGKLSLWDTDKALHFLHEQLPALSSYGAEALSTLRALHAWERI